MNNDQNIVGLISLDDYEALHFMVSYFKGSYFVHVRKYLKATRYAGYTKQGVALKPNVFESLLSILKNFNHAQSICSEYEIGRVSKDSITDIIVRVVKGQKNKYLLDIREYVKSDCYEGWTKKGVRIPLEYFNDVKALLYACRDELVKVSKKPIIYTSENQSNKVVSTKIAEKVDSYSTEVKEILGETLLRFPEDFIELSDLKQVKEVTLPKEPLKLGVFRESIQYVIGNDDFTLELRNEVEAKYVIYAQLCGATSVHVPADMFAIFKAVKNYETYVRHIQMKLKNYYKEHGDKLNVAKYKARLGTEKLGFHWIEEER